MKHRQCDLESFIQNNDKVERFNRVFISNGKKEKESWIAERQRERVRERQSVATRQR